MEKSSYFKERLVYFKEVKILKGKKKTKQKLETKDDTEDEGYQNSCSFANCLVNGSVY